jgi:purine-nucleoside phosphorylase
MISLGRLAFQDANVELFEGSYCYLVLPNYESVADIQRLQDIGGITVGASTVPEQLACYFTGMRRVVFSCGVNPASGMSNDIITEDDIISCGNACVDNCSNIIKAFIKRVPQDIY